MRVLVTGGCGFIGSELARQLVNKGYDVTVADNLSKLGSYVKPGYKFFKIDLTNSKETNNLFKIGNFDVCLNLAAKVGGIGYLNKIPASMLSHNNHIFSSTFEAAVKNNLKRMIYVSSVMALEAVERFSTEGRKPEEMPISVSGYGLSKLIGEQFCIGFKKEFGLDYSICRPLNVYGIDDIPGEEVGYSHVIPDFIKKTLDAGEEFEILGDGQQSRYFTHVSDLARGIIAVMESDKAINQDFNISLTEETKIIDLARRIWELCGREEEFKPKYIPGFSGDVKKRMFPDISKINKLLGWKPEISLDEGLKEVIQWFKLKRKK